MSSANAAPPRFLIRLTCPFRGDARGRFERLSSAAGLGRRVPIWLTEDVSGAPSQGVEGRTRHSRARRLTCQSGSPTIVGERPRLPCARRRWSLLRRRTPRRALRQSSPRPRQAIWPLQTNELSFRILQWLAARLGGAGYADLTLATPLCGELAKQYQIQTPSRAVICFRSFVSNIRTRRCQKQTRMLETHP